MTRILKPQEIPYYDTRTQQMETTTKHVMVEADTMEQWMLEAHQAIAQGLDPSELNLDPSQLARLGDMDALTIQQGGQQTIEAKAQVDAMMTDYMQDKFEIQQEGVVQTALPASQAVQATNTAEGTTQTKIVDVLYGRNRD